MVLQDGVVKNFGANTQTVLKDFLLGGAGGGGGGGGGNHLLTFGGTGGTGFQKIRWFNSPTDS